MSRATSLLAYYRLVESERLSRRQREVLAAALEFGQPFTASELQQRHPNIPGLWKRLSELRRKNKLVEDGERVCRVTKQTVVQWRVADDLIEKRAAVESAPTRSQGALW